MRSARSALADSLCLGVSVVKSFLVSTVPPFALLCCEVPTQGEDATMPEVYVHAIEGRSKDQKRALIKDITDAVVKNFGVTADAVLVEIIESSRDNKAKGGVLFSER